jgi:bifunctional ADP-heptose synthase (sugar kinase/adenylyltransferase)
VDTRHKIQEPERLQGERVRLVAGTFDVLQAAHARRLAGLKTPGTLLGVAVLESPASPLSLRARAEMVAALSCVDWVFAVDGDLGVLVEALQPIEVVGLESEHAAHLRDLVRHVQGRHAG